MDIKERLQQLLIYAQKNSVTDIHFLLQNDLMRVKMRSGGEMVNYPSVAEDRELCNYLSYLSGMDLTDRNRPQSGAFQYSLFNRELHFRFSMITSLDVTSFCLRILYQQVISKTLSRLPFQNRMFEAAMKNDSGLIIFSGPTGSGKTSSAYGLLKDIRDREIYTIEDPIELPLENAVQLQVNKKKGLTYAEGIRQLMRHDPDIVLIGEIRDEEEAMMAVRSALTGHLTVSTIHARSCSGAIERLLDLRVREFDLYETLILIANQRLVKDGKKEGRFCLYEVMDEKEISCYRKSGNCSSDFLSLASQKRDLSL